METDVVVLGAGPHGLAAACHLRIAAPKLHITVLDRDAQWLTQWRRQFAHAEIATLRSPIVHHPSPNPGDLSAFIDEVDLPRSGLAYDQPTTAAFDAFCRTLIERSALDDPHSRKVRAVRSDGRQLEIDTDHGQVRARHVIVASNPNRRVVPDWTWPLLGLQPGLVSYGQDVDLRDIGDLTGRSVAVVGGGLTAAHLVCGAAARGANVHLLTRAPLRKQSFDTDPGWLGPKLLDDFLARSCALERLAAARAGRPGGSIPDWMHDRLGGLANSEALQLHEGSVVLDTEVDPDGGCRLELDAGSRIHADHLWLATGTQCDVHALRATRSLLDDVPTHDGYPLVDERLQLGPHPVFVMGRLAMSALGPAAGNLWGAQRAARRIAQRITGVDLEREKIMIRRTRRAS